MVTWPNMEVVTCPYMEVVTCPYMDLLLYMHLPVSKC